MKGYGICDGENVERLWSYLRRFSAITKEMSPSHRTDLLTEALLHYTTKKTKALRSLYFFFIFFFLWYFFLPKSAVVRKSWCVS